LQQLLENVDRYAQSVENVLLPSFKVRSSVGLWSPSRPLSGREYGAELLNQTWLSMDLDGMGVATAGWVSSLL
jgi:hypothetical protein